MDRVYPFEEKKEETEKALTAQTEQTAQSSEAADASKAAVQQGKGRRGGNSTASRVIHSGNVTERARAIQQREEAKDSPNGGRTYPFEHGSSSGRNSSAGRSYPFDHSRSDRYQKKEASGRFDAENDLRGKEFLLTVTENAEVGSFLELKDGKKVLLPFAEQTHRPQVGEKVSVTLYEDKGGRLTATMRRPLIAVGSTGVMTVAAVTKIGAFADNGMPKQVLIPYKEMLHTPSAGDQVLVNIYQDKSGRQAGTMRVYRHLKKGSPYLEGDHVEGFVYEIKPELGAFVAVDDQYYGLIPARELFTALHYGDRVTARVSKVREDGKLDLLLREKLYMETDKDAEKILQKLEENKGSLPYADKADADLIMREYSMSKNQFKRALGALYRKRLIEIDREKDCVRKL